jgi:hypothetical protein
VGLRGRELLGLLFGQGRFCRLVYGVLALSVVYRMGMVVLVGKWEGEFGDGYEYGLIATRRLLTSHDLFDSM